MVLTHEVPGRRVSETPSVTSEKGERSIVVVLRGVVQKSPPALTREVPDRRMIETPSAGRALSTSWSSAQDIVSSKPATTSRQLSRTDRATRKRHGQ